MPQLCGENTKLASKNIASALAELYANIPDKKRISYGRVHTIKVLAKYLYTHLTEENAPVFEIASQLYAASETNWSKGVALGILADHGMHGLPVRAAIL